MLAFSSISVVGSGILSLPVTPMQLEPGDYWIMGIYDDAGSHSLVNYSDSNSLVYYFEQPFGTALPANASNFTSYTGQDFLYFAEISCGPLSVSDFDLNTISVFPNPATDFITLGNLKEPSLFQIYDLTGKKLMENELSSTDAKIDVSGLQQGMYFINTTINLSVNS